MSSSYQEKLNALVAEKGEIVRWLITLAVSLGALMELVDMSIVNVALPYIKGNLGATLSEVGWVITGYSMANAIMIPLTAWLGEVFGRKGYFVFSLIGFTLASVLCGLSGSLTVLVIARITQGLFGGGLLAKAQSIIFETFPKERQGLAQSLFGICVIVGPILGPTLGGYLTDLVDWRWIFFINIPFGILAVTMCSMFLPDDGPRNLDNLNIDWLGILFLTVGIGSLQFVLEKGQDDDWFSSRTIFTLAIAAVVGLTLFIAQELTTEHPAVDLRILKKRSVSAGVVYSLIFGAGMYGTGFLVPNFAQSMLNYTATGTGLLLLPGTIATGFMMPFIGTFSKRIDARLAITIGSIATAISMFQLSELTANTGWDDFFWPLILRGAAAAVIFMPLTLASIGDCKPSEIAKATGFLNLSRQLGGSVGVALLTTILTQRQDFHRAVLSEKLTPFSQFVQARQEQFASMLHHFGANGTTALDGSHILLNNIVISQSAILSYEDLFWITGMIFIISIPTVFLLAKGSSAAASAH